MTQAIDRVNQAKDKVLFEERLQGFLKAAQAKRDAYLATFKNLPPETISVAGGVKWLKLVNVVQGRVQSVYAFVNTETGNIHKPATFKAPVTNNPRSNIFDEDYGASGVNHYGPVYLR